MSSKVLIRAAGVFTEILTKENPQMSQEEIQEIVEKRIQKLRLFLDLAHEASENDFLWQI